MVHPKGTKNTMRTPKEKEKIILEYYYGTIGCNEICRKYGIDSSTLRAWRNKYEKDGLKGLDSNPGKSVGGNKGLCAKKGKTIEEKLKLKIMRLKIENERLKKGYIVKGGGNQKEYVTTLDKNMK